MKPKTIHEAIDQLVNPRRVLLFRDDRGYNVRGDVPSLIDQLHAAVARDGSGTGTGRDRSRPPIAVGVMALLTEMDTATAAAVKEAHGKHLGNIPDNLRRIAADHANRPAGDPDTEQWTDRIIHWADRARAALGLEPRYPRGLRGIPCPQCGTDSILGEDDTGQKIRHPALQFEWSLPVDTPDDEMTPDRSVRAVVCQTCGATWWAGAQFYDLQEQIQTMLDRNLTEETLAR